MASPQKENGYTPISNELLDVIMKTKFSATQLKIIFVCCRRTYGFSKKDAELSETFLAAATGISKRYISEELLNLIGRNIITVVKQHSATTSRILAFNKDYEQWGCRTKVPQVNKTSTVEEIIYTTVEPQFHSPVEVQFHQKSNILKQELKQSANEFFSTIWKLYPLKKGIGGVSDKQKLVLQKIGFDVLKKCIERYVADKEDWKAFQLGSTFFNSGYKDYLDENYQQIGITETPNSGVKKVSGGIKY